MKFDRSNKFDLCYFLLAIIPPAVLVYLFKNVQKYSSIQ